MLKDKVFIKSAAYPFLKSFQFGDGSRVCRFCKKTFCCRKCRDRHVDKVHPNVNADCSLCASEILPIRQCEFANLEDELLCHIVDKHLPLHCRLCGHLFESKEDFKSIAACKWYEHWHCLRSPTGHEHLEIKLKSYSRISESNCDSTLFYTPSEIFRKTSTPMFVGQRIGFETPCVPEFNLKTPKTNSPSITQIASISQTSDTQFFSFLLRTSNEEMTPFRTNKDEQLVRNNSGRKLNITEEEEKIGYEKVEKITVNAIKLSPVDMDLTTSEDSPESDDVREDVVKKVRFSNQYKTVEEFGNLMESCVRTILNMSMEEEEFHDAHNETNTKATTDIRSEENPTNTNEMKDSCIIESAKSTNDSQAEDKKRSLIQPSGKSLSDSQIRIIQDNTKNIKKENRDPEVSKEDASSQQNSTQQANQRDSNRDSNRVLMMVLMQSNSGELTNDLMPLISSGLKKLQEQLISANCQPLSSAAESPKVCRRSITTMKMSVSSVENYSNGSTMTNHGQLASSSSSSSVQNNENNHGFLSAVAQAMKYALRSLSVSGLRIPPRSVEVTEVIQRREIIKEVTSSQGSSSDASNSQVRPGKRTREVIEGSSKESPITFTLDIKSPDAKRQKGWYKMIKGRQPINRMRNNRITTSPRGVSAETQVFSQGSLTVGDTVLPLPTRAHQSTE